MKTNFSIAAVTACALFAAIPLVAANKTTKIPNAWPPENLSGKILMVNPAQNLVVVQTPDGVPFDMDITAGTRIKAGDQTVALKDLTQDINKQVSVHFVPERRGDVARSIRISS